MPEQIRPKTEREHALEHELRRALSALRDLEAGYPWRELHINLDALLHAAEQLGVVLDD